MIKPYYRILICITSMYILSELIIVLQYYCIRIGISDIHRIGEFLSTLL